jgi:hypothetical protein
LVERKVIIKMLALMGRCIYILVSLEALGQGIRDVPGEPTSNPEVIDPRLYDPPMRVPKASITDTISAPQQTVSQPKIKPTLESDEKSPRPLDWEFSLALSHTRLKTSGSYKKWKVDPNTQIQVSRRLNETPYFLGLRILAVSAEGTIANSTGITGSTYVGPSISYTSIKERRQTSMDFGASFVKMNGRNLLGPGETEFSSQPGFKTDPPGLWWNLRYGKVIGGALSTGLTTGMQWGRRKIYFWAGVYSSGWF